MIDTDRVATVRARLADGRTVSDFDVLHLLEVIQQLEGRVARLGFALERITEEDATAHHTSIARRALIT
jgi:hypothetical protein